MSATATKPNAAKSSAVADQLAALLESLPPEQIASVMQRAGFTPPKRIEVTCSVRNYTSKRNGKTAPAGFVSSPAHRDLFISQAQAASLLEILAKQGHKALGAFLSAVVTGDTSYRS